MRFEVVARIHGIFSVFVVRVPAALAGAAARPMLDHRVDAVLAPAALRRRVGRPVLVRRLESVHIRFGHRRGELRIFAERSVEPAPSGVRRDIDLRRKRRGNAERPIFDRSDFAELLHRVRVKCRREAERSRPSGYTRVFHVKFDAGRRVGRMPRIRGVVGRYAERRSFRERLDVVVPFGVDFRRCASCHKNVPHMVLFQILRLRFRRNRRIYRIVRAVQHQAGDLRHAVIYGGHDRREVRSAFFRRSAPILVRIERAVFIQVLEYGIRLVVSGNLLRGKRPARFVDQPDSRRRGIAENDLLLAVRGRDFGIFGLPDRIQGRIFAEPAFRRRRRIRKLRIFDLVPALKRIALSFRLRNVRKNAFRRRNLCGLRRSFVIVVERDDDVRSVRSGRRPLFRAGANAAAPYPQRHAQSEG